MDNFKRIETIIKNNKGYITRKDINNENIPATYLSIYVKRHNLIKHCKGFYSLNDWVKDDYLVFQYLYPKMIYSFYSSAYINHLGDYIPTALEVTGPKNYRPFKPSTKMAILHTDTKENTYNLGITEKETIFGNKVLSYDAEKTVCDFIKNRDKIDSESFVKCINYYKKRSDKDINKLMKYSRIMKIENKVNEIMEVVLNDD